MRNLLLIILVLAISFKLGTSIECVFIGETSNESND